MLADTHGNVSPPLRARLLRPAAPAEARGGAGPEPRRAIREGLCDAALALAREVGYVNAGTAEFLVDPVGGTFYFLEMNARIQVEHGVTELLCGVDLVCEQLRVAAGLPLSVVAGGRASPAAAPSSCASTPRTPSRTFMPSPGRDHPAGTRRRGPGVRVDAGVEAGRRVVPFYDSMVAKVMVWGTDREQALARARRALDELTVEGIKTTRDLQRSLLDWDEFTEGRATTESLESYLGAAA